MDDQQNQPTDPNEPEERKRFAVMGLVVAFLPAAMLLAMVTFKLNIKQEALMIPCVISMVCCLVSSVMLFSRRTVPAVLFALLLLLLNGFIAFFFGCLANFRM